MIRLKFSIALHYEILDNPSDFILNIHAAQTRCQTVATEHRTVSQPVETVLYTLPDDKPVWTATTRSLDPRSRPEMIEAISHIVETELLKKGLVGGAAK